MVAPKQLVILDVQFISRTHDITTIAAIGDSEDATLEEKRLFGRFMSENPTSIQCTLIRIFSTLLVSLFFGKSHSGKFIEK